MSIRTVTTQAELDKAIADVRGILDRAGADANAPEGSQAWALAQIDIAFLRLVFAAKTASAVLGHAYHTQITGDLANDAHDAYQRLDAALAAVEGKA